ncbi:efflux RND transporter permease subunit [Simkania negevensis]|uniref:Efflux RND transporter permease subunit n=1 Tax=Simkania negevensis TaxID=83561 RepID=A0ABS3ARW7_9BACT|nr:efflux RND transporter permease subunit [Simkania negevensis]
MIHSRWIAWLFRHPVTVNLIMFTVIVLGVISGMSQQRALIPEIAISEIEITVPMQRAASAGQVDRGVIQVLQPGIQYIDGIKEIRSTAYDSYAKMVVKVDEAFDIDKVKDDIQNAIEERLYKLPRDAERPSVVIAKASHEAIWLSVYGKGVARWELRKAANFVKSDLFNKGIASRIQLIGGESYELTLSFSPEQLHAKGVTVESLAAAIRAYDLEVEAGSVQSGYGHLRIKSTERKRSVQEFAAIPIRFADGEYQTLAELVGYENINNGFVEEGPLSYYNGMPAVLLMISGSEKEDIVNVCSAVKRYVQEMSPFADSIHMAATFDLSVLVEERINLIMRNALQGIVLIVIILTLFLEWEVALWAVMGMAFSIIGTFVVMRFTGDSLNMISLFGLLVTTGIIVDDAIVISEGFHANRTKGMPPKEAAAKALEELGWPVVAMVLTTVIAFFPLFFVVGTMGKVIRVMPLVVISALLFSLFESVVILPVHLAYSSGEDKKGLVRVIDLILSPFSRWFRKLNRMCNRLLELVYTFFILPTVTFCIRHRYAAIVAFVAVAVFVLGFIPAGIIKTSIFPRLDSIYYRAVVEFQEGTPREVIEDAVKNLETGLTAAAGHYRSADGITPVKDFFVLVNRNKGDLFVELLEAGAGRKVSGQQFVDSWRAMTPSIPNVLSLSFEDLTRGGEAAAIEVHLVSHDLLMLKEAKESFVQYLRQVKGVVDLSTSDKQGALSVRVKVKDGYRNTPVTEEMLFSTLSQTYFGAKIDAFYRDEDEVAVYLRAIHQDRTSLSQLEQLHLVNGMTVGQVADISVEYDPAEIVRVNGERSIVVTADVDDSVGVTDTEVLALIEREFLSQVSDNYPGVFWAFSGKKKEGDDAMSSMMHAYIPAIFALYLVLATMFRSYTQPLMILMSLPFSFIGVLIGHLIMGMQFSLMSVFGVVALTGIAVNDSIVLVDCINRIIREENASWNDALIQAVQRRLRPIFLTTVTTACGLAPVLFDLSFQAQFLKPMVASIVFGVVVSTLFILILIPAIYSILADLVQAGHRILYGNNITKEEFVKKKRYE